ncbi:MAG: UDP-N-acetylmuramoyl-L-alanyl-D-glutamate--2,6-diaminopimelate ligase [Kordiimonadaceae bacterium]|jgi:UDP-N-acetylmuramoyl-L-alanyl-D-glutamate--2,6-diaminopimelate ligase|nr:UDP-N-acetylmuramoyl-L-alanyl-D-glutamate--2,6-diaminopimelate ligase [Kordiimonadaceae bacterium]MBT6036446.1 UDP-N-acetylmuramoyl-L-alanyl-D-glutamate--2,6-diaminopimelate ligase [Kordiimonadaceae bacterium]MBT6330075.1 UDP-N-acetylmuramoyl-L-alanyl-D-glutamate--2,6-diaminopimelate ligase [Kordiimonadaceae bacterium]MBT7583113.1 UDP-N-acetylmuramoyl-L-alanyl-D-glutamate--2,6-diaminopimelate ligase [Kordiimonadaceae bacterium]
MKLSEIINNEDQSFDVDICGITADSRRVDAGFMFVALPGLNFNGADFIEDAIASGATAILCLPEAKLENNDVVWILDDFPGRIFPHYVSRFFNAQPENIAAVTGTNGKTSVAFFTQQIWKHLGIKSASVGTLGIQADGYQKTTGLTTPDPVVIHKALSELCDLGVDHVVFEASSHGLDQRRLDGVNISAAAFTNLTHDHLDYHKTEREYFNAKKRLFSEVLSPSKTAVLNIDSPLVMEVQNICEAKGHKIITVGHDDGDIRLLNQCTSSTGQEITVSYRSKIYDISLPLVGHFQAINALMAVGLVIGCGGDADSAFKALSYLRPVRGRMEQAGRHPTGGRVYVDYAHTPDALDTVLHALKPHVRGKLSVVFGCGGDRDKTKRKIMGEIAKNLADRVYVTDDNPRSEKPSDIREEILTGCPEAVDAGNRATAIQCAVSEMERGDILLVAGKGHEQGQTIGDDVFDFDDVSVVRSAIATLEQAELENKRNTN